jgi:hypothetical protein
MLEFCNCKTCGKEVRKAVTQCDSCGTAFCLDCLTNHNKGGGDGGPPVITQHSPDPDMDCPVCGAHIGEPELFTSKYWEAIGITDYTVQSMIISAISTGAMMHWS